MAKDYKQHDTFGPGGMRCPCCNKLPGDKRSMKDTKRQLNRRYRRKTKQTCEVEG